MPNPEVLAYKTLTKGRYKMTTVTLNPITLRLGYCPHSVTVGGGGGGGGSGGGGCTQPDTYSEESFTGSGRFSVQCRPPPAVSNNESLELWILGLWEKLGVPFWGAVIYKEYSILGPTLGSYHFGKLPFRVEDLDARQE